MTDWHHLTTLGVEFVTIAVLVWLIVRRNKIFELNIDIEPGVLAGLVGSSAFVDSLSLKLKWRGAKNIPINWNDAFLNTVRGKQLPVTLQSTYCKLTFILDGRCQVDERGIASPVVIAFVDRDTNPDFRFSLNSSKPIGRQHREELPAINEESPQGNEDSQSCIVHTRRMY